MSGPLASVVEGKELLQVIWVSFATGIGVTAVFALGLVGATRALDLSRAGRRGAATAFGVLAALAAAGVALAVVLAIVVMTHKS